VSGVVHPSYQSARPALGLLEDDTHWDRTLEEATIFDSPQNICQLFAVLLVFCQLADPLKHWEKHKESMSEDVKRQLVNDYQEIDIETIVDVVYNKCLVLLEQVVFLGLPSPSHDASELIVNRDYLRELSYDVEALSKLVYHNITKLNPEQSQVYYEVIRSVDSDSGRVFSWMQLVEQEKRF